MLELANLSKTFGGILAVDDLSMTVSRGLVSGLIGPNGSGKTTTINLISGFYRPSGGQILFKGTNIAGKPAYEIARHGVARTFQNMRLFSGLSVESNIRVFQSAKLRGPADWLSVRRRGKGSDLDEKVERLLRQLDLESVRQELAGGLSLGEQKRLEIARALATEPALLLLDEPAGGMSLQEIESLASLLGTLVGDGLSILLVEHNMRFVMEVAQHIAVLNFGKLIASGTPQQVRSDPAVIEAYLGDE